MKTGIQAMSMEILNSDEEIVLRFIKERWSKDREKTSIMTISNECLKNEGYASHEKARQIVYSLYHKGQILLDVKGKERLCRPNHVTVFAKSHPIDFRNFTILDEDTGYPLSRIWVSLHEENKHQMLSISESKQTGGKWETTSNISIPMDAFNDFLEAIDKMREHIKK